MKKEKIMKLIEKANSHKFDAINGALPFISNHIETIRFPFFGDGGEMWDALVNVKTNKLTSIRRFYYHPGADKFVTDKYCMIYGIDDETPVSYSAHEYRG